MRLFAGIDIKMGIEAELEAPEHGFKRTLKDLFSGAVGGVAQVLLGTYIRNGET